MISRVLSTIRALALLLAILAAAPGAFADALAGEWDMKMDYQGNLIPAKLVFTNKDGQVSGTWSSQRGESPLSNIKCEGGKLTFTRSIKFQDQEFELNYDGTIEGDKLTGKFTTPMGEMAASGERVKSAEPAPAPAAASTGAAGTWELTVNSQLGERKRTLVVNPDMTGTYKTGEYGDFPVTGIKLAGDVLTYETVVKVEGNELAFKFEGTIKGDDLTGKMVSDMGEATVAGKRAAGAAAPAAPAEEALTGDVNLPGSWKMSIQTPDGSTNEGVMTVTLTDGKISAVLTTDLGEIQIPEVTVAGNAIDFKTQVDFGGTMVPVTFKGSTGGDRLKGVVTLTFEGQDMSLPAEGSRQAKTGLTGAVDLPGTWTLDITTPDGAASSSEVVFTTTDGKLTAKITTELGEGQISDIKIDGNSIAFKTEVDYGGTKVPIEFSGSTGGNQIEGLAKVQFEGQTMELPIKGTKAEAKPAASAAPADAKPVASACCSKPTCTTSCKGSAGCGACCSAA